MKLSVNEFQALMVAYNPIEAQKIPLANYDLYIEEELGIYKVSFIYNNKPRGFRGAVSGFPEPTFEIEKSTLKIIKMYYGR